MYAYNAWKGKNYISSEARHGLACLITLESPGCSAEDRVGIMNISMRRRVVTTSQPCYTLVVQRHTPGSDPPTQHINGALYCTQQCLKIAMLEVEVKVSALCAKLLNII